MTSDEQDPQQRANAITVEIYDQAYHLRGQNPEYIEKLAAMVDGKMRAVAAQGTTVDSLRVAVLAALNIADQLATLQRDYRTLTGSLNESESSLRNRTSNLNGLLDSILDDGRRIG